MDNTESLCGCSHKMKAASGGNDLLMHMVFTIQSVRCVLVCVLMPQARNPIKLVLLFGVHVIFDIRQH